MLAKASKLPAGVEPLLLGREAVAELLGMSLTHFDTMNDMGQIGPLPTKFGRRVLYVHDELREWVKAGMPGRTAWLKHKEARR